MNQPQPRYRFGVQTPDVRHEPGSWRQAVDAPKIFTPEYYARMRDLESASWWNAGMRDVAASVLEVAELPARGVMLDVGCGSGQTMTWFRRLRPDWRTVGLDVASEGLGAAS